MVDFKFGFSAGVYCTKCSLNINVNTNFEITHSRWCKIFVKSTLNTFACKRRVGYCANIGCRWTVSLNPSLQCQLCYKGTPKRHQI
jgi:hypothetical protein